MQNTEKYGLRGQHGYMSVIFPSVPNLFKQEKEYMYVHYMYIHIACSALLSKLSRADSCNNNQLLNWNMKADNLYISEENSGKGKEGLVEELAEDSGNTLR